VGLSVNQRGIGNDPRGIRSLDHCFLLPGKSFKSETGLGVGGTGVLLLGRDLGPVLSSPSSCY
jgi:hypothetical protein